MPSRPAGAAAAAPAGVVPGQPLRFLDERGNPRPVKIKKGVVWSPINGKKCDVGGCGEVAYMRCANNLDHLGFPYGWCGPNFNGCGKHACVTHTFMRPKILGKTIYRCRDKECNLSFFKTIKKW